MIIVCDINEIWRRKPFVAMAGQADVLGVSPADWLVALRRGFQQPEDPLEVLPIALPPGWASRLSGAGQYILWKKIEKVCRLKAQPIEALVFTSPHYLPFMRHLPDRTKTFYYASDDYRNYVGWAEMEKLEKRMVCRVDHSFFISEALARRACAEYGVPDSKVTVSMNGTEERFLRTVSTSVTPPTGPLPRPIAGVIGGIGDRIDMELLERCAGLKNLGTLLLVGPLPEAPTPALQRLLEHPKCVATGAQPHETMHRWFQCLDVGLIPYTETAFNRMCSPMRLFDHLAGGMPVVANAACDQTRAFADIIDVCEDKASFVQAVSDACDRPADAKRIARQLAVAQMQTWTCRASGILRQIGRYMV